MAKSARHQLPRREEETRRDLSHLIELLKKTAADCASYEGLTKKERARWIRQGESFSSSVAELEMILTDRHPVRVREYRLYKLFEVLGSACFIAARVEDLTGNRLRTAKAANARHSPLTQKIVEEKAEKIRREFPGYKDWHIAGMIEKSVNEKIKAINETRPKDGRLPPLTQTAVYQRLRQSQID